MLLTVEMGEGLKRKAPPMLPRCETDVTILRADSKCSSAVGAVGTDDVVDLFKGMHDLEVRILRRQLQLQDKPIHFVYNLATRCFG